MALNNSGKNAAVDGLAAVVAYIAVHSAPPDDTGSNELAGGPYTRLAVTWTTAAGGVRDNSAQLNHPVGAGQTAAFYGLWSAVSGGTYYGSVPRCGIGESRQGFATVDSAGVTTNTIQSAGHGLSNTDRIVVLNVFAETLPGGLAEATGYHIVGATTDTFQVSLTSGGSAVDITSQGELAWQRFVAEVFASAGTLQTGVGALDLSAAVV